MRILMIAPQPFYTERGTPMNVRLLCQVLGEAGNQVDLLVFPTGKNIKLQNVRVIRLPNLLKVRTIPVGPSFVKLGYDFLLIQATLWLCFTNRYDVLHGIEEGGFLAVIIAKIFRKASVFDMDSCISEQLKYSGFAKNRLLLSFVEYLEKWCLAKSTSVITVCQALTEKAKQLSSKANIFQIEDIPIPNTHKTGNGNLDRFINQFELERTTQILYTGNLESYQGIDLLIDAWELFCSNSDSLKKYKLLIVGGTEDQIEHYKKIASDKIIQDSICWVGQRPAEEMGTWMSMSSALVSPRIDGENTPLKIYSYMSSGRPIIATRRKTHTQVLDDSMAFLTLPDPLPFSQALYDATTKPELSIQKAAIAKRIVDKKYNYNVFQQKLLTAYASIC